MWMRIGADGARPMKQSWTDFGSVQGKSYTKMDCADGSRFIFFMWMFIRSYEGRGPCEQTGNRNIFGEDPIVFLLSCTVVKMYMKAS